MKIATMTLASALALSGTVAFAQSGTLQRPSSQGAPTGAAVDSLGSSTNPGAVKRGTSAGGPAAVGGTTVIGRPATPPPGKTASEQGAPTSAAVNARGDETQPGAVKQGTSTGGPGGAVNRNVGVTTGAGAAPAVPLPGKTASEQGAPTGAAVYSRGDETQPGAVKQGTSTSR